MNFTLLLVAFAANGETINGGQAPLLFDNIDDCLGYGHAIYVDSPLAWGYEIDGNNIIILYPDGSTIVGNCEENTGI